MITLFFFLLFLQDISNPIVFLVVSIFATAIPDIDNRFSKIGHYKLSRIFNFFVRHRGITHSFSFLAIISFLIFLFPKEIFFAFLLGYALHLLADGLTVGGIRPLYPLKWKIKGRLKTGGFSETFIFVVLLLINLFLLFSKIYLIAK
jgi:membrane-bound metal-dependent hydrolase YbcI (DUF457 family)